MGRPDLTLLPLPVAFTTLSHWTLPHLPPKLLHSHEKISDAELLAVALLQKLHKVFYFSRRSSDDLDRSKDSGSVVR